MKTLGQIAYEAAAKVSFCDQEWAEANQSKWEAAANAVAAAEREACIAATVAERVDFEATGSDEDEVYNTALWHAVEAMQRRSNISSTISDQ